LFSQEEDPVPPRQIREFNRDSPALAQLEHDGIEDAFIEKASVIWYWNGSRWLQLAGAN